MEEAAKTQKNPHLASMKEDVLYHIGLSSGAQDLEKLFGDVKVLSSQYF